MKTLGIWYMVLGAIALPVAVLWQQNLNGSYGARESWAAWVIGLVGIALFVTGSIVFAAARDREARDARA